ncbi:hypothetical protein FC84_GL000413 [Lapidilactobacillus dextrinicus DSM 20335]|uniref:DUF421 domain-containing protein n=1 Tax=Lapidilactobacillus dextrinicus DSM 20335 TaxID=1423738 RepID=A0A0R2BIF8_9LACO|nr:YetF domain-containing protein [Lapidilactobacillus dextrinicus]KRM78613.1 hypothetical protein FC84_GL000413 [Lapidilactobacillus dextrinicus DSM 20335]QFG46548.1 DUF421 domain-containing protein [Lapidilactobacillus dextrinicus]
MNYWLVFEKMIVTIVLLLFYNRLSGLRKLAPMTTFDTIGNLVIGAISGTTLLNERVKPKDIFVFVLIWLGILLSIRYLKGTHRVLRNLIDGQPIFLMRDGHLYPEMFRKVNTDSKAIESLLRNKGVTGIHTLDEIIIEPNGQISYTTSKKDDFSQILIDCGQIRAYALKIINQDEQWLRQTLAAHGYSDIDSLFCVEYANDTFWIYADSTDDAGVTYTKIKINH